MMKKMAIDIIYWHCSPRIFMYVNLVLTLLIIPLFLITGCDKSYTYTILGSVTVETKDGAEVKVDYQFEHTEGGVKLFQSKEQFVKTERIKKKTRGIKISVEKGIERETAGLTFDEINNDHGKNLKQLIYQALNKHYKTPSISISLK